MGSASFRQSTPHSIEVRYSLNPSTPFTGHDRILHTPVNPSSKNKLLHQPNIDKQSHTQVILKSTNILPVYKMRVDLEFSRISLDIKVRYTFVSGTFLDKESLEIQDRTSSCRAATKPIIHILPPFHPMTVTTGAVLTIESVIPHRTTS